MSDVCPRLTAALLERNCSSSRLDRLLDGGADSEELRPLRRLAWARLLRVIRGDSAEEWQRELRQHRQRFQELVALHRDELDVKKFDANICNPLSRNTANPFLKIQANDELIQEIWKDIERTYPEVDLLQAPDSRKAMQNVLFHWCRANNPAKDASDSYRQGMNELVAVLYYVVRTGECTGGDPLGVGLCGREDTEADTFTLFSHLMEAGVRDMFAVEKGWAPREAQRTSPIGELPATRSRARPSNDQAPQTAILARCFFIFEALRALDEQVHRCLEKEGVAPQIFLLRWLRLLFCREFHLEDTLVLWDGIFIDAFRSQDPGPLKYTGSGAHVQLASAASAALPLVDYVAVAMIVYLRKDLLEADVATGGCVGRLLKFPPVGNVKAFLDMAVRLRAGNYAPPSAVAPPTSLPLQVPELPVASTSPAPAEGNNRGSLLTPPLPVAVATPLPSGCAGASATTGANRGIFSPAERSEPAATPPLGSAAGLLEAAAPAAAVARNFLDVGRQALAARFAGDGDKPEVVPASSSGDVLGGAGGDPKSFVDSAAQARAQAQAQAQIAELRRQLAAAEQKGEHIRKKASEFFSMKQAEWNTKATELEARVAASEAKSKRLEEEIKAAQQNASVPSNGDTQRAVVDADAPPDDCRSDDARRFAAERAAVAEERLALATAERQEAVRQAAEAEERAAMAEAQLSAADEEREAAVREAANAAAALAEERAALAERRLVALEAEREDALQKASSSQACLAEQLERLHASDAHAHALQDRLAEMEQKLQDAIRERDAAVEANANVVPAQRAVAVGVDISASAGGGASTSPPPAPVASRDVGDDAQTGGGVADDAAAPPVTEAPAAVPENDSSA